MALTGIVARVGFGPVLIAAARLLGRLEKCCYDRVALPTPSHMTKKKIPEQAEPTADPAQDSVPLSVTDGSTSDAAPPVRKPMARATRITLFEREVRERLSRAALDILFARAELISEGQRSVRGGKDGYFGSTMLTMDLPALSDVLRDACDAGTAHRLVALMEADGALPRRIREIAEREASRIAKARLKEVRTHVAMRAQGAKVFIDIDVEAGL